MRICFADVFFVFFSVRQKYETTVFGKGLTDFHETLTKRYWGKCSLKRRAAAWRKSCRRLANVWMICVIYDMTLSQSPEGATHGGCVIQP